MASPDEAAAMKRNLVHQTRLELSLKQLDRDRSVRLREMDKDTQVFLTRLGEKARYRTSVPPLTELTTLPSEGRITSAPAGRNRRTTINTNKPTRPQTSRPLSKQLSDSRLPQDSSSFSRSTPGRQIPSRDMSIDTGNRTRDSTQHRQISGFKEVRFQTPLESLQEKKQSKQESQRNSQTTSSRLEKSRQQYSTQRRPRRLNTV